MPLVPKLARCRGNIGLYKINFFSEYGHAAYQIKGNEAYNSMIANILPLHMTHYVDPWGGVKSSIVLYVSLFVLVALLHGAIGWSVIFYCGLSWLYCFITLI